MLPVVVSLWVLAWTRAIVIETGRRLSDTVVRTW